MDSLKKISDSITNFSQGQFFKYVLVGLVVLILGASSYLVYLNSADPKKYPKLETKIYKQVEENLLAIVDSSKTDPHKAIDELERQPPLPKQLENRRRFILARLYDSVGESVLAFIRASEIDEDYLPKHNAYFIVKLAEKVGHEAAVIKKLELLRAKYPNDPKFLYELAKSHLRQSQTAEAKKTFVSIKKLYPNSEQAIAANYYLANLTDDKPEKLSLLKEYLEKSPNGSLAYLVSDQILAMDKADQAYFKNATNYMAISYQKIGEYEKALELFNTTQNSPELYLKPFVDSLLKLDKQQDAKALVLRSLPKISNPELANEMIDVYLDLTKNTDEALLQLQALKDAVTPESKEKVYWEVAKLSDTKEDYYYVYENFPRGDYAAESLKKVFWKEFQRENYHKALDLYKDHWKEFESSRSHAFVAFWAGKIHLKLGEKENARAVFQNLIIAHPDNYYGFRANQILEKKNKWYLLPGSNEFIAAAKWSWPTVYKNFDIEKLFGSDTLELTKAGQYGYILGLADSGELKIDDDFRIWLMAKSNDNVGALDLARKIIKEKQSVADTKNPLFQFAYPLLYEDLITDETSKNLKVDPMLVHSLIRQESSYQESIISPVGAVGLMQVMPYTAKDLAKSMGIEPPATAEDLMKVETNIQLGVRFLEEVLRKFDDNLIYSIASYNAGPVAVGKWIEKFEENNKKENLDYDLFVENMPYDETREYTKRVLNNYWIYKQLYN